MQVTERDINRSFELGFQEGLIVATKKMLGMTKTITDTKLDPKYLPYPEYPEPRRSKA